MMMFFAFKSFVTLIIIKRMTIFDVANQFSVTIFWRRKKNAKPYINKIGV